MAQCPFLHILVFQNTDASYSLLFRVAGTACCNFSTNISRHMLIQKYGGSFYFSLFLTRYHFKSLYVDFRFFSWRESPTFLISSSLVLTLYTTCRRHVTYFERISSFFCLTSFGCSVIVLLSVEVLLAWMSVMYFSILFITKYRYKCY